MSGPTGRTVQVSWHIATDQPIRYRATPNQITVSNDEDGALIDTVPLPTRHQTRLDLARLIAGDDYRVVPVGEYSGEDLDAARAEIDRLNQAAQPDRPEPVDPASVQVGDVVEVVQQHDPPLRVIVEGEVYRVDEHNRRYPFHIRGYGAPAIATMTSVRVLHAAAPEPGEAAVEAIEELLGTHAENMGWAAEPSWHAAAKYLVRNGVRMVSD